MAVHKSALWMLGRWEVHEEGNNLSGIEEEARLLWVVVVKREGGERQVRGESVGDPRNRNVA